ncbi:hypothetical protein [Fervidobacterium thailandense]|uniref:Na+-translocating membrane potential-generating system MpsC domain-containing protein n=1 Tax=Fervidobacterium thailandense TaxID=1008305 RepID=A0A1E3G2T5_9BACT|nr:hypothetical protein [Fervidobacterium thailandense]ODN30460.1 hypothetical protein A4H02_05370 [Fervidobacterium thailandense]
METEKLVVMMVNDLIYYLLKNGAHLVDTEIVASNRDFYILIEANVPQEQKETVEKDLKILSKIKEHPELRYYSALSQQVGGLEGIYTIAPYIKKIDFDFTENGLKLEVFVIR